MTRRAHLFVSFVCCLLPLCRTATAAEPLQHGAVPPPFKPLAWLKGEPVTEWRKGHVYVVEFWNRGCGPCLAGMPHLTELAKKYAGKVTIVTVAVREPEYADVPVMQKFVKKMNARMGFTVAFDDPKSNAIADAWNIVGFPHSFIIDRDGKLAWLDQGNLDDGLARLLDGSADWRAFKAEKEGEAAKYADWDALKRPIEEAFNAKDYRTTIERADRLLQDRPEMENYICQQKMGALLKTDVPAAIAYAQRWQQRDKADNPLFMYMNMYLGVMLTAPQDLSRQAYETGLKSLQLYAERDFTSANPSVPYYYAAKDLARAYLRVGDLQAMAQEVAHGVKSFMDSAHTEEENQDFVDRIKYWW